MMLTAGETFAGFRIISRISTGDMGQVYLVQEPDSARRDELHVLPAELTTDDRYRARFEHDAGLAAGLSHPNVPAVYAHGETDHRLWVTVEFVDGVTAADLMRDRYRTGMPVAEVLGVVEGVASALDQAHRNGLLHRAVKPSNVLVSGWGSETPRIRLRGFGIPPRHDDTSEATVGDTDLDAVAHAAPELLMGEDADGRSDQYALACTAFDLLTGSPPYPSTNAAAVINKHVMAPPPSIAEQRADLSHLDRVLATAMAKDPRMRYPTCRDFADELARRISVGDAEPLLDNVSRPDDASDSAARLWDEQAAGAGSRSATSGSSRTRVRIRNRWWRRTRSGAPWTRRKIVIAALATVGILATFATTFATTVMPLLAGDSGRDAQRPVAAAPTRTAPPVIGRPLMVRPVLEPPLQPQPGQCPAVRPPAPPAPEAPLEACAVDDLAVYRLGPVGLQLSLTGASAARVPTSEFHTVQMSMDAASSAAFGQYTAANVGKQVAFVRDGVVLAAPAITQPISGETLQISGELDAETAGAIARMLRDGT